MSRIVPRTVISIALAIILSAAVLPNVGLRPAYAVGFSPTNDASTLANAIIGPGISIIGTPTLTGIPGQQATFSGGSGSVGFGNGIALTTGDIAEIPGSNSAFSETLGSELVDVSDDIDTNLLQPGDADLSALVGAATFDANVLQFDFQLGDGSQSGDLAFNYAFASEEYVNFIGSEFNDVFALYVDGVNIAQLPDTSPVSINNVNPTSNSGFYVNNVDNTDGFPVAGLDFHFDGRTTLLTAQISNISPGTHTMKFAVADTSDGFLDSAVFVQAGTFSIPDPCDGIDNNQDGKLDEGTIGVDDNGNGSIDEPFDGCESITIGIDIKPNDPKNTLSIKNDKSIRVAILSSANFDALTVDVSPLSDAPKFGGSTPRSPVSASNEDVNGDGFIDLVLKYNSGKNNPLGFDSGTSEGCISGKLTDGTLIEGCDAIRVVK